MQMTGGIAQMIGSNDISVGDENLFAGSVCLLTGGVREAYLYTPINQRAAECHHSDRQSTFIATANGRLTASQIRYAL